MCCFSRPVRHVSKTKILARPLAAGRQLLVYSMSLEASVHRLDVKRSLTNEDIRVSS